MSSLPAHVYVLCAPEDLEQYRRALSVTKESPALTLFVAPRLHEQEADPSKQKAETEGLSAEKALSSRQCVILGGPGAGKTLLTQWILVRLLSGDCEAFSLPPGTVPFHLPLKELEAELIRHGEVRGGLLGHLARRLGERGLAIEGHVRDLARAGRLLLLLDGLDEVRVPRNHQAVTELIATLPHAHPEIRLVVTSRPSQRGEFGLPAGWPRYVLEDFGDAQIHEYVTKWYQRTPASERASSRRDRLLGALGVLATPDGQERPRQALRELARNPLLLNLLCRLNRGEELPRRRHQVFQRAVDLLVSEWDEEKGLPAAESPFEAHDKLRFLRELAWAMQQDRWPGSSGNWLDMAELERFAAAFLRRELGMDEDKARLQARALLGELCVRDQVLGDQEGERVGFVHRAFQEYLAAEGAVRSLTQPELAALFRLRWQDQSYKEVLTQCCGLLDDRDEPERIVRCLQAALREVPLRFADREHRFFFAAFAIRCLAEVHQVRREPLRSLLDLIMRLLHQDALTVAHTWMWAWGTDEVLSALRLFGPRWPDQEAWRSWALRPDWRAGDHQHRGRPWAFRCVMAGATLGERVPLLVRLLSQENSLHVAAQLMEEAGLLGPWQAQEALDLGRALHDADKDVQIQVGIALGRSAGPEVAAALLESDVHTRLSLRRPETTPEARQMREGSRGEADDIQPEVRAALLDLARGAAPPRCRLEAAEGLARLKEDAEAAETSRLVFGDLAGSADEWVRLQAAAELHLYPVLAELAASAQDGQVRRQAADHVSVLDLRALLLRLSPAPRRRGRVHLYEQQVGVLEEIDGGSRFSYDTAWLRRKDAEPVSLAMPLRAEPYEGEGLLPFFENLLPEGPLLDMTARKAGLSREDKFGILLASGGDCAGAVEVYPLNEAG